MLDFEFGSAAADDGIAIGEQVGSRFGPPFAGAEMLKDQTSDAQLASGNLGSPVSANRMVLSLLEGVPARLLGQPSIFRVWRFARPSEKRGRVF